MSVVVGVAGVDVLVSSRRGQTFCPAVFDLHGIDIATKRCIGLKSVAHFRAGFTLATRATSPESSPQMRWA